MEIYLIRHTTPDIEKGICYGQTDIGLADTFEKEAVSIRNRCSEVFNNAPIYSSPLKRCYKLAHFLAQSEPIKDMRLLELNFGDWEMKRWDEIDQEKLGEWMSDFVNVRCPHGESYQDLYKRSASFYEDMTRNEHEKIFIVTHAGVIRSLLAHLTATPLNDSFNFKVGFGDVKKISVDSNQIRLQTSVMSTIK